MIPFFLRKPAGAAVLVLLSLALAGCGRRGALEPPPGSGLSTPSSGPVNPSLDAGTATTGGVAAAAPATQEASKEEAAKAAKPKPPATKPIFKSIFLDPLVD